MLSTTKYIYLFFVFHFSDYQVLVYTTALNLLSPGIYFHLTKYIVCYIFAYPWQPSSKQTVYYIPEPILF
jgi:hypothetical protein